MSRKAHRKVQRKESGEPRGGQARADQGGPSGSGSERGRSGAGRGLRVDALLDAARITDLRELHQYWVNGDGKGSSGGGREDAATLRSRLRALMLDPGVVEARVAALGKRLSAVFEDILVAPRHEKSYQDLAGARTLAYLSDYDLEACLSALARRGLVADRKDDRFESLDARVLAVPREMAEGLLRRRREKLRGIFGVLTLRGLLDQVYSDPEKAQRITPQRLRELYKMYSQETASVARIERLPEGIRGLVEKAILEFGGILPRQLFERMETELPHWNGRRWRMILEQSLIGTVRDLDLTAYGIQHQDETLIVFNEVALAWLRRVAVPGDPDRPHEELSLGIDVASNVSRFLSYVDDHDVRFTVQGEIFKTTRKRIVQHLIANPGRELTCDDVLTFVFRFARNEGLVDRTGKRTFSVTQAGREWSAQSLLEKQKRLLGFALEDRLADGEPFHHRRVRQIFLRLLKRVEVGVWYDLMYLPFLARNSYLSSLDELRIEEQLAERTQGGSFPAMEDPQRLAWNLVRWVRQRLYLLGVVDLGYDRTRRPVAMRLTPQGARLLGVDLIGPEAPSTVGSIVVTPDFEVVLFPTGDDSRLIHDLDRFCTREKLGSLMHFSITDESVRRALKEGMRLADVLSILTSHSRTPVPQNVTFSIRDWAVRAGLMTLSQDLVLRAEDPDVLRRFRQDPGTRPYVAAARGPNALELHGRVTPRRLRALLRELGHLVELEEWRRDGRRP